jgi:hypothetical protein
MIAVSFLIISCGSGSGSANLKEILKKIPSSSTMVSIIDMDQMMKKMDYQEFKKSEIFKSMLKEAKTEELKKILENPEISGISINSQFGMYVDVKSADDYVIGFILPIKSIKDFEAQIEKTAKEEKSPFKNIKKESKFKFVEEKTEGNNIGIAWNDKMLIMNISSKSALKELFVKNFESNEKESILSNKEFKVENAKGHDILFWAQTAPIMKLLKEDKQISRSLKQIAYLGLTEKALEDNSFSIYCDFKKAEMESGMTYSMSEELTKEYGSIFSKKISTDFTKFFPKKDLVGLSMLALDLKAVNQVLKNRGFDGLINMFIGEMGLTIEDFTNGLKGEIAFANYIDPSSKDMIQSQKMVLAIAMNDPAFIDKLVDLAFKSGMGAVKKSGKRYVSSMSDKVQGIMVDKVFIISTDISIIDKIEKGGFGGNEAIAKSEYDKIKDGWLSNYVDYIQMVASLSETAGSTLGLDTDYNKILKKISEYNELEYSTSVLSDKEAKFNIYFKNKENNSLKTIVKLLDKVYLEREDIKNQLDKFSKPEETLIYQ